MTKVERMKSMVAEARLKNLHFRIFDCRYSTCGYPEIEDDHVYFPPGSFEVIETGTLDTAATNFQKLKHPKAIPMGVIITFELTPMVS